MSALPIDPIAVIEAAFPKPPAPPASAPARVSTLAQPGTGYAAAALAAETQRVLDAQPGTRNHTLNRAAFSLGQLVAGGALEQYEVADALAAAAHTVGLGAVETERTITSGLTSGAASPRGIPDRPDVDVAGWLATLGPPSNDSADNAAEIDADTRSEVIRRNLPTIDWHALWADQDEEEWIIEPLLPARRLIALYSAPKVGKSLLLLELCVAIVTGRTALGTTLDRPRNVLYIDFENDPKADVRERLQAMRVGPDDLARLHYLSFPNLAALDSDRGGQEVMAAVTEYECEVVVVDTVSRAIAGEENENDTWLNFYRHTGLRMKQAGVALIRLDHSGKDETKGQRGGSAKSGDVDAVWRLSRLTDDSYRLDCEAARMPIAEKTLVLHRELTPLRHRVDPLGRSAAVDVQVAAVVKALNDLDVPLDSTLRDAASILRAAGNKARNGVIGKALKKRLPVIPEAWGSEDGAA
jgi:hypothetical protein